MTNFKKEAEEMKKKHGEAWWEKQEALDEQMDKHGFDARITCIEGIADMMNNITEEDLMNALTQAKAEIDKEKVDLA